MGNITITTINTESPQYPELIAFRNKILRIPVGFPLTEQDMKDDRADTIMIAGHDEKIVGCLILKHTNNDELKLRQMAVETSRQGKGIGRDLVAAAEELAVRKGYKKMTLHAREVALDFYRKCGYAIIGDRFTEVGIPHFKMQKLLK